MTVSSAPLRVAIIGSGPSGFYAAEHLQKTARPDGADRHVRPPAHALRAGARWRGARSPEDQDGDPVYDAHRRAPRLPVFGNVEFGSGHHRWTTCRATTTRSSTPSARDRPQAGHPRRGPPGSHAATEFVGWYNGHPDYRDRRFDLSAGQRRRRRQRQRGDGRGAHPGQQPATTGEDRHRRARARRAARRPVGDIYLLGRRGPAQAAFTNPELKELGALAGRRVHRPPAKMSNSTRSAVSYILSGADRNAERNVQTLLRYSKHGDQENATHPHALSGLARGDHRGASASKRSNSSTTSCIAPTTARSGRGRPDAPKSCRSA